MRFCNGKFNCYLIFIIILMMPFSVSAQASFRSSSYVIYENIHHTFDGPTITPGTVTVDGTNVTVTWTTNVASDGFVVYSTDAGFAITKEQGSSIKNATSHSVTVTGLDGETVYYYKVKSTRVNGGTTEGAAGTFTSGAGPTVTPVTSPSGGGGIIVIDKTDKIAPIITNISLQIVGGNSVKISWETNEDATSFIEYGTTIDYGHTYGQWEYKTSHEVLLENLLPSSTYYSRILSSDASGNVSNSANILFNTEKGIIDEPGEVTPPVEIIPPSAPTIFDFFKKIMPDFTDNNRILGVNTLDDLSNLIPIPILSGSPRLEIGQDSVKVFWATDRDSNSTVAIAPEDQYRINTAEPYQQIVGNRETFVREHEVDIYNLKPDTIYHFQIRSQSKYGPMISSTDFTFRTTAEKLEITSFFTTIVDSQTAIFKWVTNKSADSAIRFSPYHGNIVAVDEQKIVKDNNLSVIHEITIQDFQGGVFYQVEIVSSDNEGNIATETIPRFSTSEEDLPPVITHIKTDSTVFVDRADKIQTIISWLTNEPTTSQVYYQEGVIGGDAKLKESTSLNTSFSKEHVVVISDFDPGKVYTFRVESVDSGNNASISQVHTFMTAKKKESIITIILNILQNTFSWINKLIPQ